MKNFKNNMVKIATSTLIVGALLSGSQAMAASACKGLEDKACGAKSECSWINGYERKDGVKVKSFCRTKAKSKAKTKS